MLSLCGCDQVSYNCVSCLCMLSVLLSHLSRGNWLAGTVISQANIFLFVNKPFQTIIGVWDNFVDSNYMSVLEKTVFLGYKGLPVLKYSWSLAWRALTISQQEGSLCIGSIPTNNWISQTAACRTKIQWYCPRHSCRRIHIEGQLLCLCWSSVRRGHTTCWRTLNT